MSATGGWQPIETAPKDGTIFLAALRNGKVTLLYAHTGIKSGQRFSWWGSPLHYSIPYEPSHPADHKWSETTLRVTHWQPLPRPPEVERAP